MGTTTSQSAHGRSETQAWVRFLLAIAGLTIAFMAALFSTVASRQGNVAATAVLASAALLAAGLVGLFTVPYLARRVDVGRWMEAFDYDITKEGVLYLVLALVIAVAALNTGNNLLFVIVSAMLAAVIVSGVVSNAMLRRLELDVGLPEHVFAREALAARIELENPRRLLPAFSVTVITPERKGRKLGIARDTFRFPPKRAAGKQWIVLPDWKLTYRRAEPTAPPIFSGGVYFPYVAAHSSAGADVELKFATRGIYSQQVFGLRSRFPFSFLIKTRRVPLVRELVVYPSVEATDDALEILPMITGEFESFVRGRGYELYRIREYTPDDSARHVDWKATARSGSLKIREFTREDERRLCIVFDNPPADAVSAVEYEKAVELAASLAWHFFQEGTQLSFVAPEYSGSPDIYDFLRYLAVVRPARAATAELSVPPEGDVFNLIVTARAHGSIPTSLWANSYVIFAGSRG
jgi:uncharacterized protein (DUF58 family)